MRTLAYIEFLEAVVFALLEERGKGDFDDFPVLNADGKTVSPCSPYNVKDLIRKRRANAEEPL